MKNRKSKPKKVYLLVVLALALCLLAGCGEQSGGAVTSLAQLGEPGRKIGVPSDLTEMKTLKADYPAAEILPYNDYQLGYQAVKNGQLDAYVYSRREMEIAIANGLSGVRLLDENYRTNHVVIGVSPKSQIPMLQDKINRFLEEKRADGTLDDMFARWIERNENTMPDIPAPENPTLRLCVGTTGTVMPYSYYVGTELWGHDIELAKRFAAWIGAELEFKVYDFGGIVSAAAVGDVDCIISDLFYNPEAEGSILFSDPIHALEITAMVRDTAASAPAPEQGGVHWQDYNGKRIGALVGPLMEDMTKKFFPDSEYFLFNSYPDCAAALLAGKIDGFLGDEPGMISLHAEQPEIDYIHESLSENNYSFAFRKDDPESAALCAELNEFLAQSWADGTMHEIEDIWLGVDEARKVVDMSGLTGENGTVKVVTTSTDMPWSYIKDGKNVGYDIDLVVRFCRARGYALEIGDVDFSGRIPALQSGRYDFTTDMNVTPERQEQVLFSDPTAHGGIVLTVRASDLSAPAAAASGDGVYTSLDALAGKRIGVMQGTYFDVLAADHIPDIDISYYNTSADEINALMSHKIDGFVAEEPALRFMMLQEPSLTYVREYLDETQFGFAFPKTDDGRRLNEQFSEYIRRIKVDGTLDEIDSIWFGADESRKTLPDYTSFPDDHGTLTLATGGQSMPFNYVQDGQTVGYEVDIVARFCREYGYRLNVELMNFNGILAAVQSGKCDMGASGISITEERAESMLFSEPYYLCRSVLVVLKTEDSEGSLLSSISSSFEKTFLRENRWKLFLEGIVTTLLITVLSILFGTILGFAVYMACRNGNPAANVLTRFFVWLVQGMPGVVLLMILYYIIFAQTAISGTFVAIIGFTLVFASGVFGMLRSGVGAIPRGQTEASYALGYGNTHTFFRMILPQAIPHFLPAYKGEIVALIKATAIVGYIAVQDLTKMGDIVRGRTYEAFFPLIAVAVIYFILAAILTFIVNRLEITVNPRRRRKEEILKGVRTHD